MQRKTIIALALASLLTFPCAVSAANGGFQGPQGGMGGFQGPTSAADADTVAKALKCWDDAPVTLTFRHIMSKLTIRLIKGEDFEGDMPTDAEVYVHNTVPEATIDLSAGVATRYVRGNRATLTARQESDFVFSAIVVPQRVENRMPLIEVIMKGVSYVFESTFQFKPGVEHLVNMVISDNPDQVKIEVGGEIQDWQ